MELATILLFLYLFLLGQDEGCQPAEELSSDLEKEVQTLLQQMQDKFQIMSDQIIGRNILLSVEIRGSP
ncbi:Heat shock factor-binding protein 1, partial [Ophiophagus hannah]